MSDTEASNKTQFKQELSHDALEGIRKQMLNVLQANNIPADEDIRMEFGLKRWAFIKYGGHQTVVVRLTNSLVFRLELEFTTEEEGGSIAATFKCPYRECNCSTSSFREYTKHYFQHFRKNEFPVQKCCEKTFQHYILFCKHMHQQHRQMNPIGVRFERIRENSKESFLSEITCSFFPSAVTTMNFSQLFANALHILKNFGQYYVLFWNCQDYATWFLSYHGVPMNEIDPTLTDRVSASNTESSARYVSFIG